MKTHLKYSIIKWLFICLAGIPVRAFSQLTDWINYTNGDRVTKLLNDGQYLWATTYGGLVRFTKSTGEMRFYTKAKEGLASNNYLRSIAKDKNGVLWVTSERKGITKIDGTKSTVYNTSNSGLPTNQLYDVAIDKDNNPWFGAVFYLYKKEGDAWKQWLAPGNLGQAYNFIYQLKFDEEGVLWLAGDAPSWIFAKFQNDTILSVPPLGIDSRFGSGNGLEVDEGTVWLATSNGLFKYKDEEFTVYNTDNS